MPKQFTENSNNIRVRAKLHAEVCASQRPYPTNVGTAIGEQSAEYKKAKKMANMKRVCKKEGMSESEAYAYAGKMCR